jgi:hypothetical protein
LLSVAAERISEIGAPNGAHGGEAARQAREIGRSAVVEEMPILPGLAG